MSDGRWHNPHWDEAVQAAAYEKQGFTAPDGTPIRFTKPKPLTRRERAAIRLANYLRRKADALDPWGACDDDDY